MSQQSANQFVEKLASDVDFARQMKAQLAADSWEAKKQAVEEAGFDFTSTELQEALANNGAEARSELSEEELDSVTGGSSGMFSTQQYSFTGAGDTQFDLSFGSTTDMDGGTMGHATYW